MKPFFCILAIVLHNSCDLGPWKCKLLKTVFLKMVKQIVKNGDVMRMRVYNASIMLYFLLTYETTLKWQQIIRCYFRSPQTNMASLIKQNSATLTSAGHSQLLQLIHWRSMNGLFYKPEPVKYLFTQSVLFHVQYVLVMRPRVLV